MTSNFKPKVDTIKDEQDSMLSEAKDVKERWKQYCYNLYKRNDNHDQKIHINHLDQYPEQPILYSEVEKAINEIKKEKALGLSFRENENQTPIQNKLVFAKEEEPGIRFST